MFSVIQLLVDLGRNALLFPKFNLSEAAKTSVMGYKFTKRSELDIAVDLCIDDKSEAKSTYGHIRNWDVGRIKTFLVFLKIDTLLIQISVIGM